MNDWLDQLLDRIGRLFARLFAIFFLFSFTAGLTFLVWWDFGWLPGVVVFPLSLWLWLPNWLRAWQSIGHPQMIDAQSLFGASFECPDCGRRECHTLPCRRCHKVKSIEWEYPGRIKAVKYSGRPTVF